MTAALLVTLASVIAPIEPTAPVRAQAAEAGKFVVRVRARALVEMRGDRGPEVHEALSITSGVLVGRGLVLTDLHAVSLPLPGGRARVVDDMAVEVPNAGVFPAEFVVADPSQDIALLKLGGLGKELRGAELAQSAPGVGDALLALAAVEGGVAAHQTSVAEAGESRAALDAELGKQFWGAPLFDSSGALAALGTPAPVSTGAITSVLLFPLAFPFFLDRAAEPERDLAARYDDGPPHALAVCSEPLEQLGVGHALGLAALFRRDELTRPAGPGRDRLQLVGGERLLDEIALIELELVLREKLPRFDAARSAGLPEQMHFGFGHALS
jgi:hypothetical protein